MPSSEATSPPAMCPAPLHVILPLKCAHYVPSPTSFDYFLLTCVSPVTSLTPHHFMPLPHSFFTTTPIACPILRAGLHTYSSGRSANPGGSMKGHSRPRGAELAGPSSIPMKQLLKQLAVVRHRLRHNGKVRRRIKGTSIRPQSCQKSDCVCHWCTIIQRLQA
jgi:hypothetical protein